MRATAGRIRARTLATALPAFALLFAIFAASCDDGTVSETAGLQTTPAAMATATASPAERGWRESRSLPITPVEIQYKLTDPAFEALPGARAIFGEYQGATYQIEVPANWNHEVVYFAHGFRGNPPELTVHGPPLRQYFIDNGYAWAASSYSKNGYEPGYAARDMLALRDVFEREAGKPERSYIYGQSMGGHVVSLSLEQYPDAYDGALSECGVVSGNDILDYFLSWGVLSAYFSKTDLYSASAYPNELGTRINGNVLPALGTPAEPTAAGRMFASAVEGMSGGERPFFREGFSANFGFNFAILVNASATAGPAVVAAQNLDTEYHIDESLGLTVDQLNREVARIAANSTYRDPAAYPEFGDMTGKIARPFLTLHDTGDLFVPISLEQSYRRIVDAAGAGDLLVQRAVRRSGHCNFSEAERRRAFDDLVAWVRGGTKPAGEDLTGSLVDAGRAWTDPVEATDPGGMSAP